MDVIRAVFQCLGAFGSPTLIPKLRPEDNTRERLLKTPLLADTNMTPSLGQIVPSLDTCGSESGSSESSKVAATHDPENCDEYDSEGNIIDDNENIWRDRAFDTSIYGQGVSQHILDERRCFYSCERNNRSMVAWVAGAPAMLARRTAWGIWLGEDTEEEEWITEYFPSGTLQVDTSPLQEDFQFLGEATAAVEAVLVLGKEIKKAVRHGITINQLVVVTHSPGLVDFVCGFDKQHTIADTTEQLFEILMKLNEKITVLEDKGINVHFRLVSARDNQAARSYAENAAAKALSRERQASS